MKGMSKADSATATRLDTAYHSHGHGHGGGGGGGSALGTAASEDDCKVCSRFSRYQDKKQHRAQTAVGSVAAAMENRFAEALIKARVDDERELASRLHELDKEAAKQRAAMDKAMRKFRADNALELPTLIIERQPTAEQRKRFARRDSYLARPYTMDTDKPGFMRVTSGRARVKSMFNTIDAFSQIVTKKPNVWEPTAGGREAPRFRCAVPPFTPLTHEEHDKLEENLWRHRHLCIFDVTPEQKRVEAQRKKLIRDKSAATASVPPEKSQIQTLENNLRVTPVTSRDDGEDKGAQATKRIASDGDNFPLTSSRVVDGYLKQQQQQRPASVVVRT